MKKGKIFVLLRFLTAALSFSLIGASSHAQSITTEINESMGLSALYFWREHTSIPAFYHNREISPRSGALKVVNGYVFFTWYKGGMNKRNLMLSRRKIGQNHWVTIEFPDKNSLRTTPWRHINFSNQFPGGNSHRTTNVGISPVDGTVHLFYDNHADPIKYRASQPGVAFGPDSEFILANFMSRQDFLRPGERINSFTYPGLNINNAGELVLDFRIGTSRQGDRYVAHYDGNSWSSLRAMVRGNNATPNEFNLYGGLRFSHGKMYAGGTIRVKGSSIELNQGLYLAETGQRGGDRDWKTLGGTNVDLPIRNMDPFLIASPVRSNADRMGAAPSFLVTETGAVHFTATVRNNGSKNYHYYRRAGETSIRSTQNGRGGLDFSADGRVYSMSLSSKGKFSLHSTDEDQSDWRNDLTLSGETLGNYVGQYYKGKLHIVAVDKVSSDARPLRYIVLDLGIDEDDDQPPSDSGGPDGYAFAADEGGIVEIMGVTDVAYGANGQFNFLFNQTSNVACTNAVFGDPIFRTKKACYTKLVVTAEPVGPEGYSYAADEGDTVNVSGAVNIAYGADGQFNYLFNQNADVACNNTVFGDPIFRTKKACYTAPVSEKDLDGPTGFLYAVDEGGTVTANEAVDVAYGANGNFNYAFDQTSDVSCTNSVFGDPIRGTKKACYVRPAEQGD